MNPKNNLKQGAAIAGSVALMLFAACGSDDSDDGVGQNDQSLRCEGGNSCMGMSACEGGPGGSACEGMNECAGQGWIWVDTQEECDAAKEKAQQS